jgi:single-strand DNA-binding protein
MLSVTVTGNVARDPRLSEAGGTQVCNFTILSNSKIKGEDVATAVDIAIWGKRAETAAKYIKKGSLVTALGSSHIETYERGNGEFGAKLSMPSCSDFTLPPKPKGDDL